MLRGKNQLKILRKCHLWEQPISRRYLQILSRTEALEIAGLRPLHFAFNIYLQLSLMLIIVSQLEANWSQVLAVFGVRASHQPLFFVYISDVCALDSSANGTGSATSK